MRYFLTCMIWTFVAFFHLNSSWAQGRASSFSAGSVDVAESFSAIEGTLWLSLAAGALLTALVLLFAADRIQRRLDSRLRNLEIRILPHKKND